MPIFLSGSLLLTGSVSASQGIVGANIFGVTSACAPTVFGTTAVCSPTVFGTTTVCSPTVFGTTRVCSPNLCATTTICGPAFIGGTVSGTTVYASTVMCAASICTTGNICAAGSITGSSILATGRITAQTLVVSTISSSVTFSSGSNIFGNSTANTQTMTGSVNITGSLTVTTTAPELTVGATGVILGNLLTDSHSVTGSLRITGSNALFSVGCVGIGTITPSSYCHGGTNVVTEIYNSRTAANSQAHVILSTGATAAVGGIGTLTWVVPNSSAANKMGSFIGGDIEGDSSTAVCTNIGFATRRNEAAPQIRLRIAASGIACFSCAVCSPAFVGGTMSGTTLYGSTAVCSPTVFGTTAVCSPTVFGSTVVCSPTVFGTTAVCSPTVFGSTVVCSPTVFGTTRVCSPNLCATTTICGPAFVGGTMSGTTIYGSTAICGAVICGGATTLTGALSGTSATFNGTVNINAASGNNDLYFTATTRPSIYVNSTNVGLQVRSNGTGVLELNKDNPTTGDVNINNGVLYVDASASSVGIGTTSPSSNTLTVNASAANKGIDLNINNTTTIARFGITDPNVNNNPFIGGFSNNNFLIYSNSAERINLTSTGIACFACTVCVPQIRFCGGNAALNNYEVGTWTPHYNVANSCTGVTYYTRFGYYRRIADIVTIWGGTRVCSNGSGTGEVRITGLPFSINCIAAYTHPIGSLSKVDSGNCKVYTVLGDSTALFFREQTATGDIAASDTCFPDGTSLIWTLTYVV